MSSASSGTSCGPTSGSQDANTVVATPCSVLDAGLSLTQIKSYLPVCLAKGVK